ncbi:hypothetical protein [Oscillibacter sp. 1-3]|uniref:hypothetical protein n=1 Tax=Oscillibacter sp. 1-3 TaxID=1235797 RepID=UPI00033E86FA|nr:hypothetical protein [Oscillibacter sp. 1-3]EOS63490.1 hypothetical protein C816_03263 [Oscillibacter sp. 1-3]MCI9511367.1 hypothetical protein [Oscillibacter sp.]
MDYAAAQFVNQLVGKRLLHFCCEAEILDFDFAPLALHAMGCSRVIKNNDILVTTFDYQLWDLSESTHNDEWFNAEKFYSEIIDGTVISVEISPWYDLRIKLDNNVVIECLIANAYPHYDEEQEQWVLFEPTEDHSGTFLTVYNKRIDFHNVHVLSNSPKSSTV